MEKTFITLTHLDDFRAAEFVNPGTRLKLRKEPNLYDDESITVYSDKGTRYGYVANSCARVAKGTHSAGYIARDFEEEASCMVRFRLDDLAIAELILNEEEGVTDESEGER
jgi:hypothetical protein